MDTSPEPLLQRLEWTVLRRLDGLLQGDYRTLWRGSGLDLADLREYQHADDVRHIDWNVTARLQVPHVRQYTEDRELTAWFLLDLSGSVDFGSAERTKLAVAQGFVAALARLLTRQGNRVGAVLYRPGQPVAVLPPASGRVQVLRLLTLMRAPAAPAKTAGQRAAAATKSGKATQVAAPPRGETRLADLLQQSASLMRRRSMVFLVSDFISTPGWTAPLGRLAQRHEVLAVRLYDAAEMDLPAVGLVTLEDAETGEQLFVDTADPALRERFEALAQAQEAVLRESLARAGVDTLELTTDDDLLPALMRFVVLRRQRLRLPASRRLATA